LNKSLTALNALPLLILKIFEYKLVIVPVVDDNVVIVPDGVVIDGIVAAPFWFTNHDLVESETLIKPNVELLL
jgi:hypothetical protein